MLRSEISVLATYRTYTRKGEFFLLYRIYTRPMSDPTLQRTIRRCTAVLAIPLSLYPIVITPRLETGGDRYVNLLPALADEIGLMMLLGSVVYLILSVCRAPRGSQSEPGRSGPPHK